MRHRSFFWPFILIATGLVWLLVEIKTIPLENLWALLYIWPFFLMAAGVGLILRSRWAGINMVISAVIVAGMVMSILFAPQFAWNKPPSWGNLSWINFGDIGGSQRGSGVMSSESRQVADFSSIEINYPVEITIQQGTANSLKVEAEDNLLPQIGTRVSGGTLYIENTEREWSRRVNPTRTVRMTMTLKTLQHVDFPTAGTLRINKFQTDHLELSISGAGTVHLTDLVAQSLSVGLSGAGTINASGSADTLDVDISGVGSFSGGNLACQSADISISGAGSATTWVRNSLDAEISGTGSVKYYGSPSVHRQVSGLGSVNSLGNK